MKILECKKIDKENYDNIRYIRIDPEDFSLTLRDIISELSNLSWISKFDDEYMRLSFTKRAKDTADYLAKKILISDDDKVTKDSGEYVVSELAREALVKELEYMDVPLAELFKEKVSGNPGFDFYSANTEKIIIFGEAKYDASKNAYGKGMEQVDRFIKEGQDISDLNDIDKFFEKESLQLVVDGEKAYAIAFSAKSTKSDLLINNIIKNNHYKRIAINKEVIFLAVNI